MTAPLVVSAKITTGRNGKRTLTVVANEPATLAGVLERKRHRRFVKLKDLAGPPRPLTTIAIALGKRPPGSYRVRYTLTDTSGNQTNKNKKTFAVRGR